MREESLIRWMQQQVPNPSEGVKLGIGDDAAILEIHDDLVVTTDLIAEGSHFTREECSSRDIGRKAMAVNLSDLAAMAATPVAAFVSLLLPHGFKESDARELMTGMMSLANEYECEILGGDSNVWKGGLAISVTVLGQLSGAPLRRQGAEVGDVLLVTGELGGSRDGHHFQFQPRVREARLLHEHFQLHAGMDLSDGLAIDLRRLCESSQCGAEIIAEQLPISNAARAHSKTDWDAQQRALGDGEDFELLLAVPPQEAARMLAEQPLAIPITAVGTILADTGIWLTKARQRTRMPPIGFEHTTSLE